MRVGFSTVHGSGAPRAPRAPNTPKMGVLGAPGAPGAPGNSRGSRGSQHNHFLVCLEPPGAPGTLLLYLQNDVVTLKVKEQLAKI